MITKSPVFIEYSRPLRTPQTARAIFNSLGMFFASFMGVIYWGWVVYHSPQKIESGWEGPMVAIWAFGFVALVSGVAGFSMLWSYLLNAATYVCVSGDGIQYNQDFWRWDQIGRIDYIIVPEAGMARLTVDLKVWATLRALTIPIDIVPVADAEKIIQNLRSELDKAGHQLVWRDTGKWRA